MKRLGSTSIIFSFAVFFVFLNLGFAQTEKGKEAPTAPGSSTQGQKIVPFEDLKKTWNGYANGLATALKTLEEKGTINYEKDVLKKMINHIKPVISSLNNAKTEMDQKNARSMVQLKLIGLRIIEREYKRAESIRMSMVNVIKTGDKDLLSDLQNLAQLSNEIFNLEVNLANAQARFATNNARVSRQSSGMMDLKKTADKNAALLEKLKKDNPDVYKALTGKDKKASK